MAKTDRISNPALWNKALCIDADANVLPETVDASESAQASMTQGFPILTQMGVEAGGTPPDRKDFNALFGELGLHAFFLQQGGVYQWDANVTYKTNAVIQHFGVCYRSLQGDNLNHEPNGDDEYWQREVRITSINNMQPDAHGNLEIPFEDFALLPGFNTYTGENTFDGPVYANQKVETKTLPLYTGNPRSIEFIEDNALITKEQAVEIMSTGISGGADFIRPVTVELPVDGESKNTVLMEFVGGPYHNAFEEDQRAFREVQFTEATNTDWQDPMTWRGDENYFTLTFEEKLKPFTDYILRARDRSQWGYIGPWSKVVKFRTGQTVLVEQPSVISITGKDTEHVIEVPTIVSSAFSTNDGHDIHSATDWVIETLDLDTEKPVEVVYQSLNDPVHKTSITIPRGYLKENTAYSIRIRYLGKSYGWSDWGHSNFTTTGRFTYIETPSITVSSSPNGVPENPTLSSSPFKVVTNAEEVDTHRSTSWRITNLDGVTVWESLFNTTNLTSIEVPKGKLQTSTTYKVYCKYYGNTFESSESSTEFTTAAAFDYVNTPTITITAGTTNGNTGVLETPTFTGSAFSYTSNSGVSDTHQATEWKVATAAEPNVAIWSQTVNASAEGADLINVTMPSGVLETGLAYRVSVRYIGAAFGASEWGQLDFSTGTQFSYIESPRLTVRGAPSNVQEQPSLIGSAFKVFPDGQSDTHVSTDWRVTKVSDNSVVWESLADSNRLTNVKLPGAILQTNTPYKFAMRYKGQTLGYSSWAEVYASTAVEFSPVAAPNIVVEQDELGVYEAPLITASAFINESGVAGDNHSATDWVVLNASNGTEVWSSKSDRGHLRSIQMPNGKLQPNSTYRVQVRYQAYISGWGPWNEVEITTQETFYNANLPVLQNANIDRAGTQLRFEFSTDQLYVRPGKPRPTHLRVKIRNYTQGDYVDTFTTPINEQGNYILLRDTTYDLDASDNIEYQVFYKADSANNDTNPYSATAKRPATVNENIIVLLESISGGQFHVYQYPTLKISLNYGPESFTHIRTDWQIRDISDTSTIWSSIGDTTNLTQIKCNVKLDRHTFYLLKIKAYGVRANDQSAESIEFVMTILTSAGGDIGIPGQLGFGVGLYDGDDLSTLGLTLMEGGTDPNNDNYANYQHTNGSIFCFVPAFCYSFTEEGVSTKGTANAFYVKSFTEFESVQDANAHGYILHRAFIDGGQVKKGFFVAKYLMGKGCKAIKNNIPISLIGTSGSDASSQAEGGVGQALDAITLSKKLGSKYNCASAFIYSALSMLSFCQGLYAESTDVCAWFDASNTTNYPKGCNNNALGDVNDSSIKYTNSDTKQKTKPNTGSATPFAKTTHNGQNCGVCDLNGCIWQVTTGVLMYGTDLYMSPESTKLTDFTTSNIQSQGNSTVYVRIGSVNDYYANGRWGNAGQRAFYDQTEGTYRALCGVLPAKAAISSNGTNEFGQDLAGLHPDSGSYSALWCSGGWYDGTGAGVWYRSLDWGSSWTSSYGIYGFRAAAYAQ